MHHSLLLAVAPATTTKTWANTPLRLKHLANKECIAFEASHSKMACFLNTLLKGENHRFRFFYTWNRLNTHAIISTGFHYTWNRADISENLRDVPEKTNTFLRTGSKNHGALCVTPQHTDRREITGIQCVQAFFGESKIVVYPRPPTLIVSRCPTHSAVIREWICLTGALLAAPNWHQTSPHPENHVYQGLQRNRHPKSRLTYFNTKSTVWYHWHCKYCGIPGSVSHYLFTYLKLLTSLSGRIASVQKQYWETAQKKKLQLK